MVMGYQAYAGNGLLEGLATGLEMRKAYDKMQREKGLAAGLKRVAEGDETGWQQVAENSPETYMQQQQLKSLEAERKFDQDYKNSYLGILRDKNNKETTFGIGTAKGEYAQLLALRNDPSTPKEMVERIDKRLDVLEKAPEVAYTNAYNTRTGTLQGDIDLGGQSEATKTRGKKEVELEYEPMIAQATDVAKGKAKNELGQIAIKEQMPRVIKAAENVSNMTDEGVGPIEGRLTPLGVLSSGAEQNYENVMEMNRAMNSMIRQKLSAMGITGREMDTEREAARNLYLLNPTDPRGIREQKINNFFNNFLQMSVPKRDTKQNTQDEVIDWRDL